MLTGIPIVIDGDTIRIGNTRIRPYGIDAPEVRQDCTVSGKVWRCGQEAKNKLDKIIAKKLVTYSKKYMDRYRRVVAVCRAGSINLNAWMVENGWAVAYIRFFKDYVKDERNAKASPKGIWRGQFIMPWDWRKNNTLVSGDIIY